MSRKGKVEVEEYSFDDGVEEPYDGEGEEYCDSEGEGEDYENSDNDNNENEEEDEEESVKYSEELEYEDIGEPATFNFNIHNGTIHLLFTLNLQSLLHLI